MKFKEKQSLQRKSIVFIIMTLLMSISPFFGSNSTVVLAADEAITVANYSSWEATTLSRAVEITGDFLKVQEGIYGPQRPYYYNDFFTEGSLMALRDVHIMAGKAEKEISTSEVGRELMREQLVLAVQHLERGKGPDGRHSGYQTSSNNQGTDDLNYMIDNLLSEYDQSVSSKFDIIFVVDWSSSMFEKSLLGVGDEQIALYNARDAAKSLSRKILRSGNNSRVRLVGMNSSAHNTANGDVYIQTDTKFLSQTDNYEFEIDKAFDTNPLNINDNVPKFVDKGHDFMAADMRQDAIPVLIMMSDFQLRYGGGTPDVRQTYVTAVNNYYNSREIARKTKEKPIYLAVAYHTRTTATTYPMEAEIMTPERRANGWDMREFKRNQTYGVEAIRQITEMLDNTITIENYWVWEQVLSDELNYVPGSFISNLNNSRIHQQSTQKIQMDGESNLSHMNYKAKGVGSFYGYKKGDLLDTFKSSRLDFVGVGQFPVTASPKIIVPITDAAVNLHVYKGAGDRNNPNNYELKETIVSNTYRPFGGRSYTKKDNKLASLKYGTNLSLNTAKSVIQSALGQDQYNRYVFPSNSLQKNQVTMKADSSKNVFDVYAESALETITVDFLDNKTNIAVPGSSTVEIKGEVGKKIDVTKDINVQAMLKTLENSGYVVEKEPANATAVEIVTGGTAVNYIMKKGNVDVIVEFIGDGNKVLSPPVTINGTIGDVINFQTTKEVQDIVKELENKYEKVNVPQNETNYVIKATGNKVQYVFKGILFIKSRPETFDFGNVNYSGQTQRVTDPKYTDKMIVVDTRANATAGWHMTAELVGGPMRNGTHELPNALIYVADGKDKVLSDSAHVIYTQTKADVETTNISDTWGTTKDKDGLKFELGSTDKVKEGNYTAKIRWKVMAGQP